MLEDFTKYKFLSGVKLSPEGKNCGFIVHKMDKDEMKRIENSAKRIQNNSDIFLVIGIGGSYLGARAALEALNHTFYNELSKDKRNTPRIYYIGNNISPSYMLDLMDGLSGLLVSLMGGEGLKFETTDDKEEA